MFLLLLLLLLPLKGVLRPCSVVIRVAATRRRDLLRSGSSSQCHASG